MKMTSTLTRIPVVRNQRYRPNGLKSYVYALNKYGIAPTQPSRYFREKGQKTLMRKQDDGTDAPVMATDQQNDSFYTCPVIIGTPGQTLNLDFDSGSSDLWVWSDKIAQQTLKAGQANNIAIFNSKVSSTFKKMAGSKWNITYGDGTGASGTVGTDVVKIGDITINSQAVELATQLSSEFQNESSSGLLGLAWDTLNTVKPQPVATVIDNMISQNDIPADAKLWSVHLGSVKDQKYPDASKSFYTFGSIDTSLVTASGKDIPWTAIDNSQGVWMFPSTSAIINGQTLQLDGNQAIADTGTTLMLVSDQLCSAIYSHVEGAQYSQQQGGWLVPNTNIDQLPEISVAVGNNQITFGKEYLAWSDVGDGSNMSFGAIQSRGENAFDILGDAFLFNCYAIFDVGNKRIGCIQRQNPAEATSSAST